MSIFLLKGHTLNVMKFAKNTASMENQQSGNGPKGLIKRHEFVRVIIQCLYSLGYSKSASCLESESGISYKSAEFELLESHALGDHGFIVSSCAWFPDSKRLVCGSSEPEKCIYMWDCDGSEIKAWKGMRMPMVLDLAVTPDREYLISVCSDKEIQILNLGTNAENVISEEHPITSLSICADSEYFISLLST